MAQDSTKLPGTARGGPPKGTPAIRYLRAVVRKLPTFALAFVVFSVGSPGGANAQDNLLNRGKKLLETIKPLAPTEAPGLSTAEIGDGLREALRVGTERVVATVGRVDGFNADPEIHIPLPENLQRVQRGLARVRASGLADDLELRLNRAAEIATPEAKDIFWQAITDMTLRDVKGILDGPDDAATQYFRGETTQPLVAAMQPIVEDALAEAGAVRAYDKLISRSRALAFAPDVKSDLTAWVLEKSLDAMFLFLAREETAIRKNPAKRTTDLLRRVFATAS